MKAINLFVHMELRRAASELMKDRPDMKTVRAALSAISMAGKRPDLVRMPRGR